MTSQQWCMIYLRELLEPTVEVGGNGFFLKNEWPSLSQVLDDEEIPHMV